MSNESRKVLQIIKPQPVIEGAGVRLKRSIATATLDHLDPFYFSIILAPAILTITSKVFPCIPTEASRR